MQRTQHPDSTGTIPDEGPADRWDTLEHILRRSGSFDRGYVPIHKVFVQTPRDAVSKGTSRAGPLAKFVKGSDARGLHAYLLANAAITSGDGEDGWSAAYPLPVWARALGVGETTSSRSTTGAAMSKTFKRLEDRSLITRARRGTDRAVRITLLRPDGSGEPFTREDLRGRDRYLRLSTCLWDRDADWLGKLDLPALAMLLTLLHEPPEGVDLPTEKMQLWYGWSADTAERGLRRLEDLDVITKQGHWRKAPAAPDGRTWTNHYQVIGDFALPSRAPAVEDTDTSGDTPSVDA